MRPLKYTDFVRNFENNLASDAAHLSYFLYYRIVNLQAAKFFFVGMYDHVVLFGKHRDKGGKENK